MDLLASRTKVVPRLTFNALDLPNRLAGIVFVVESLLLLSTQLLVGADIAPGTGEKLVGMQWTYLALVLVLGSSGLTANCFGLTANCSGLTASYYGVTAMDTPALYTLGLTAKLSVSHDPIQHS